MKAGQALWTWRLDSPIVYHGQIEFARSGWTNTTGCKFPRTDSQWLSVNAQGVVLTTCMERIAQCDRYEPVKR